MLHPSYSELMEKINYEDNEGEEPVINSRYSIVIATSRRARQLIAGGNPLVESYEGEKPLSIAVDELYNSKIKIDPSEDDDLPVPDHKDLDGEFEELQEVDPALAGNVTG